MAADTELNFNRERKALRILIEQVNEGVLAFGLYSSRVIRSETISWLHSHSTLPVRTFSLSPELDNPVTIVGSVLPSPRCCLLFVDVEAAFPKFLGYVNFHREELLGSGHALVFWVREEGLRRIVEESPDFWSWRSRVFDFRTFDTAVTGPGGSHDPATGQYDKEQLTEQVQALEADAPGDLVSALALGRRLVTLRRFPEGEVALQQAISLAEQSADQRYLAQALLLLGNSKLEQSLLEEAESLYRKSFEVASQSGLKDQCLSAVRQLSFVEQRKGKPDAAYELAVTMMQIAETLDDPTSLASAYDQMGNVLFAKRDLRGAEKAYLAAINYEEQVQHNYDLAITLARIGQVYEEMGSTMQAQQAISRAAQLLQENGFFPEAQVLETRQNLLARQP